MPGGDAWRCHEKDLWGGLKIEGTPVKAMKQSLMKPSVINSSFDTVPMTIDPLE